MAATVTIDRARWNAVVSAACQRAAYRGAQAYRGRAMSNIIRLGRIETGAMITGLQVRRAAPLAGNGSRYRVGSTAPHVGYQEFGTRAHGPRHASVMVFRPKGSGSVVFATSVRGVEPGRFLRDARREMVLRDFTR